MIWQDTVFDDDVTQSKTNVAMFSKPGEKSAEGEDATENGRSQGETCFLISINKIVST